MTNKNINNSSSNNISGNNQPNPVDVHVGGRLRLRRILLGISQKEMAENLGITFQQVQKYENGINRISASRLWDISKVLKIPVEFFFSGMDDCIQSQSPMRLGQTEREEGEFEQHKIDDPMQKQETIKLIKAFSHIGNERLSHKLLELMVEMSTSTHNS